MRLSIFVGIIALLFVAKGAFAACSQPANQITNIGVGGGNLTDLLSESTVCAIRGEDSSEERWQEEHHGALSGELWDYKLGDNDPVDPRKKVGSWAVRGTGINTVVIYGYGTGGTYRYSVWDNGGGSYSFCDNGTLVMDFTVTGIGSGCP